MANSILAVKWERFFVDVGIPERIASEYATKFTEHRVQFEMRGELTKSILMELGIKALGDQVLSLFF
uniref:SAM domain-containing protein n=1 Tax=Syphacia muris TaxID=451379 RepID=A0A0N5AAL3_9BILA